MLTQTSQSLTPFSCTWTSCSNTGLEEGKPTLLPPLWAGPSHWGTQWICPSVCGAQVLLVPTATCQFLQRWAALNWLWITPNFWFWRYQVSCLMFSQYLFSIVVLQPGIHFPVCENNCSNVHNIKMEVWYMCSRYFFILSLCWYYS